MIILQPHNSPKHSPSTSSFLLVLLPRNSTEGGMLSRWTTRGNNLFFFFFLIKVATNTPWHWWDDLLLLSLSFSSFPVKNHQRWLLFWRDQRGSNPRFPLSSCRSPTAIYCCVATIHSFPFIFYWSDHKRVSKRLPKQPITANITDNISCTCFNLRFHPMIDQRIKRYPLNQFSFCCLCSFLIFLDHMRNKTPKSILF